MKKDNLVTFLISWILAFGLSVSTAMCLATGFDLTVDNLPRLIALCCGAALGCSILFQLQRGSLLFLLASAVLGGCLWRLELPRQQLLALLQYISRVYDNAYHWGYLALSDLPQSADYPLMLLGYLTAASVSFWGCRGKGRLWTIAMVLLPLFACLVVTDTVPDAVFLFLILAGIGVIILTASVRRQNIPQGNRLLIRTAVPIVAALGLLFASVPQAGYTKNRSDALREQLSIWVQTLPQQLETHVATLSAAVDRPISHSINLAALAEQNLSSAPVMTVTAQHSGTLYLRGQDYDGYTGTGWISDADRAEVFTQSAAEATDVTIRTHRVQDVLYIPYYPAAEISLLGGLVPNRAQLEEYSVSASPLEERQESEISGKYGVLPDEDRYLSLPEASKAAALPLLEAILPEGGSNAYIAAVIADFVRSSAVYDRNPGRMPREEADFALWFLEDADRGYCVHFATAAVVLLRAADVPARYVTGYMTSTQPGISVTVTGENAHAWAEYYEPRLDAWLILEATPADGAPAPPTTATELPPVSEPVPTASESHVQTEGTQPSIPEATAPNQAITPAMDWTPVTQLVKLLVSLGLTLLLLSLQRSLRIALRRKRQTQGAVNSQALERWREAELLSRLLKQTPTEELLILAQKASFSQHDLTAEELGQFDSFLRACRQQLRQKSWYLRLIHQYVFAAY